MTASGCGTHIKDYGHLFRTDAALSRPAADVASRAYDISEVLHRLGLPAPARHTGIEVAYHSACSMQHGQQVETPPRALLEAAGFVVKEIPEPYTITNPEVFDQLHPTPWERRRAMMLAAKKR